MCLKLFLVILLIIIENYSSVAQQQNCRKVQINNSEMYGECCIFVKDENINLQEEVEETLSKRPSYNSDFVPLIRKPQANNDFTLHNISNGTLELQQYHRDNRPPPGGKPNRPSSINKDTEDQQPNESKIRRNQNNQFDNPIIMKFESNNRGAENKLKIQNIGPHNHKVSGNPQSGEDSNREIPHRDANRVADQNMHPIQTFHDHRNRKPPSPPVDQHNRDIPPHSYRKTPTMNRNDRGGPQDTGDNLNNFSPDRPQDNLGISDSFPPRRQDNPERPRLQEDFPQKTPPDNPSFEFPINKDNSMGHNIQPNEEPLTRPHDIQRPNSPPLQRNRQKTDVIPEKKMSASPPAPDHSTIKPSIKSSTEDDSSDIVFLPDHPMEVPKVDDKNITSNVSGVVVDNRNAVGVPNERVLPNGDRATEF